LDKKNYTPLMVAAAWNNDELFQIMMDEDSASVHQTLFQAAKLPDLTTIRASEYLHSLYMFLHHHLLFTNLMS